MISNPDVTRTPCEAEWASRSLTDLDAHLRLRYRRPVRQRLEAVQAQIREIWTSDRAGRHARLVRLGELSGRLADSVNGHAWIEEEVLSPAIANLEGPAGLADRRARHALRRLIAHVEEDHLRIRTVVDQLVTTVGELMTSYLSTDELLLVADLEMVAVLLLEQMDLEDRCLWPRAMHLVEFRL